MQLDYSELEIYVGETFFLNVTPRNFGEKTLHNLNIEVSPDGYVAATTPFAYQHPSLLKGTNETYAFSLLPMTSGNYSLDILIESQNPVVSFSYQNQHFDLDS